MSQVDPEDDWIFVLSRNQLLKELTRRRLSTEGSYSIQTARLLRRVREDRQFHSSNMSDEELLEVPRDTRARPDSPMDRLRSQAPSGSRDTPRSRDRDWSRETTNNSAMTAYNIMRRWNLKFSGTQGEDAETFLLRIEEGRELVPMSDEDILRCLPFFLSGMALYWFRSKRDRLSSWAVFKNAWRTRFGDPDFQFALREEIMRRTQGEHESVANFLTCLRAMFDRLSPPWSESERVSSAFRNLLPRLQQLIRRNEVEDLEALEDIATRVEASFQLSHRYHAPPAPEKSLFPDLAYQAPRNAKPAARCRETLAALSTSGEESEAKSRSSRKDKRGRRRADQAATGTESNASRNDPRKCWNCNEVGHISRNCSVAPRLHCYRCGRAEVTIRSCPDCSGKD